MISSSAASVHSNLVLQERYFNPQHPTLNPQMVTYTRGLDLSGSLEGAGGIGGLLARSEPSTFSPQLSTAFYQADGNGNITALMNENEVLVAKYIYDPYGNIIAASGPLSDANLYRFSSKEWHANSGLVYYLYRYYEPSLQRWLNRDPIEEQGGIDLHSLVHNGPSCDYDAFGAAPMSNYSVPIPGPIFPEEPSSTDKNQSQVSETSGNAPVARPAKHPKPCKASEAGQKRGRVTAGTEAKECPCSGTVEVTCYEYEECMFHSMSLRGAVQYGWTRGRDCPCPE
jgi:RHS repeat-associated protein